ncbi:hypothetical protein [Streptomyces sp. DH24]|uniref:hypothetical protein n=1 Tax=Streptomyces sp. DH24 TaxID=3040123 RepID=UPI0024431002|nr:hypothetical protein [Streptomyces sp. DH24]MDG9720077.1 hypothetical protein [Streptomyces sp. DH24]
MDLDALRFANFGPLDDAVDDWSTMIRDLETLEKSADNGLRRSANKANWSGVNAAVSRQFIGKTAEEFKDALNQARSIRNILRDTCSELKGYQTKLKDAIERGLKKNLTVTPTGNGGFTVTMNVHPDRAAKGTTVPEHNQSDVTALRDEVQKILDDAAKRDNSANTVLRALVDQTKVGFSDAPVYSDRDEADRAVRTANELAELAKKKPEDLTARDFDHLNKGLKEYANDELFADRFAGRLGAQGTLDFWTGLTDPHRAYGVGSERSEKYAELQKNLSLTLATATQSDSAAMIDWKTKMVDLADKPVGQGGGFPLGGQVMSNLMRWGNYDDHFLVQYGEKLVDAEKKFTGNGTHGAWNRIASDSLLNRTATDSGWDPTTGYLKALSNSPDAATTFFNDTFVTKDEKHDFTEKVDGKEVKRTLSNFEYFFEERDWPEDLDDEGETSIAGRNYMALALEAAATGHPAGEEPTADTPPHTAAQALLVESLVSSVSEKPARLTDHEYMSDSMGQIAAEYMPDIHRGLHPGSKGEGELFPIAGTAARLGEADLTRFLYTVGRNPEGYAAVNLGQQSYTTHLMHHHFDNPDAYAPDPAFPKEDRLKQAIEHVARTAGQIEGFIGAGRAYESELEGAEKDAEYNATLEKVETWGGTVVGIGIGLAATPATGPGGVIVGGVAGTAADEIIGSIIEGSLKDSSGDVVYRNGTEFQDTKASTYVAVEAAAQKAGENTGNQYPLIVASVGTAAESGFDSARTKIHDYFEGEGIPRALDSED